MSNQGDETIVLAFVKVRDGVDPARFAEFASTLDLPTWRGKDVVHRFDTYRLAAPDESGVDADFVEVMHVRSFSEWESVCETDPDVAPLAKAFAELVDEASVRRIHLTPLDAGTD